MQSDPGFDPRTTPAYAGYLSFAFMALRLENDFPLYSMHVVCANVNQACPVSIAHASGIDDDDDGNEE